MQKKETPTGRVKLPGKLPGNPVKSPDLPEACVRTSQIHWRDDHSVSWLERHLEMTQGFIVIGKNPGTGR